MKNIKFSFLGILLFIFVSCLFSPGMNPNIQNNIPFDQIDKKLLWSYKIHEFYNSIKKNNSNT
jgi:hypothetical protein